MKGGEGVIGRGGVERDMRTRSALSKIKKGGGRGGGRRKGGLE